MEMDELRIKSLEIASNEFRRFSELIQRGSAARDSLLLPCPPGTSLLLSQVSPEVLASIAFRFDNPDIDRFLWLQLLSIAMEKEESEKISEALIRAVKDGMDNMLLSCGLDEATLSKLSGQEGSLWDRVYLISTLFISANELGKQKQAMDLIQSYADSRIDMKSFMVLRFFLLGEITKEEMEISIDNLDLIADIEAESVDSLRNALSELGGRRTII